MRGRRWMATGAAVLGAGMLVTGCGGEEGSGSDSSDEIVIGTVGSYTGVQGGTISAGRPVLQGWVKMINDQGGIKGKPVRLVVKDDANDPAKALTGVKELVQRDRVSAIVGPLSNFTQQWAGYIESTDVPVLGGVPFEIPASTSASFFPIGASLAANQYGILAEAKRIGPRYANIYCSEAPVCAASGEVQKAFAKDIGVELAVVQGVSGSQPDYSAICNTLKRERVDSYTITHSSPVASKIGQQCRDAGLDATIIATGGIADNQWLDKPELDGTRNIDLAAPFFDDSTEGNKAYRDFLSRYVPDIGAKDGPSPQYAYLGAELFRAAVEASDGNEVTPASIKQGLYSLEDETLDGQTSPLTYRKGQPTRVNCWYTTAIQDGKWTAPNGTEYQCAPDKTLAPVLESLK